MTRLIAIDIRDFRNIERAALTVPEAGFVLIGENGQGKTNLLEAIYYLQILRSMRGARDQELVRFDMPAFYVQATVERRIESTQLPVTTDNKVEEAAGKRGREHTISAAFERQSRRKKVVYDGAHCTRLSDALGALPSVVLSPTDTALVSGSPQDRRRFLDVVLSLTSRRYLAALQAYRAALVHRNAALREVFKRRDIRRSSNVHDDSVPSSVRDDTIAIWEPTLAQHGAVLTAMRATWVREHAERFSELCTAIGERSTVTMRYACGIETPDNAYEPLLEALSQHRMRDIKRGITHVGPHRDDVRLAIDAHDLRTYGSAGQQRTAAIALRMLEATTLRAHTGSTPLLLLDDPFAELDARRSAHILKLLQGGGIGQTILAVPRETDIPRELTSLPRWQIAGGVITPSSR